MNQSKVDSAPLLPGGTAVWVFVGIELITFGLFFLGFAASYADEPDVFSAAQKLLHPTSGLVNTGILLTGSWLVARAVHAHRSDRPSRRWFVATALAGTTFVAIKLHEYIDVFGQGLSMGTNQFWFFYLFLTFVHLLHVLGGIGVALFVALYTGDVPSEVVFDPKSEITPSSRSLDVEATATYWHLVDLIWIILFPLLYLAS